MKKIYLLFIIFILLLTSCTNKNDNIITNDNIKEEENEMELVLKIDDSILNVNWENNESVNDLKALAKDGLTIHMNEYGGFEQTGSIGKSIKRNDSNINVIPGDIVLYNGNAISVFYNPSSWSYTMLGHINLNQDELKSLLKKSSVTFKLEIK